MLLAPETYKIQQKLAQYCRDGKEIKLPGTTDGRLPHYRRLVFNVIKDSMESAFPVTHRYISRKIWDEMLYLFFERHTCHTPQVWKLPFEFYEFAVSANFAEIYQLSFLNDLLYFEWIEIEVYMMEDRPYPDFKPDGDWLNERILINPEYRLIRLNYPVHLMKPTESEAKAGNYFLLLFREQHSGRVQFINLSVLYTFVVENLANTNKKLNEIIRETASLFEIADKKLPQEKLVHFLINLKDKGFILGFQK